MTIRVTIALAAALAVLGTAPAFAAPKASDMLSLSAAKKKKRVVRHRQVEPQGEIACGWWGCRRIPPNCHIQGSILDWQGDPTGNDDIRCR